MGHSHRVALLALGIGLAGCRSDDVAPPDLRRPLEDIPAGAQAVVLLSDLHNTWQRVESHQLWDLVSQREPLARLLHEPEVVAIQSAIQAYEQRSGSSLRDDVGLNVLGKRAAAGVYGHGSLGNHDVNVDDVLLVGELTDPARLRAAFEALQPSDLGDNVKLESTNFASLPAWRLQCGEDRDVLLVMSGSLFLASTQDSLISAALAVHAGKAPSALQDAAFAAALGAAARQNIVTLWRNTHGEGWLAQGLTWDPRGVHFEMLHSESAPQVASDDPVRREQIMKCIPDGMAFACYTRGDALGLGGLDHTLAGAEAAGRAAREFLPAQLRALAGDEIGLAVLGVEPTALAPIPNLAVIVELRDAAAAAQSLRLFEATLGAVRIKGQGYEFEDVQYGGRTFRSLVQPISQSMTPSWLVDGDVAIITTTRALMEQVVDTRRTGKRGLQADASFRAFHDFVPHDATAWAYADTRRLRRALDQAGPAAQHFGTGVARIVENLQQLAVMSDHFPAGAAYAAREDDRIAVRGWVQEKD